MQTTQELVAEFRRKNSEKIIECPLGTGKGTTTKQACLNRRSKSQYIRNFKSWKIRAFKGVAIDPCPTDCPNFKPVTENQEKLCHYGRYSRRSS